jgi:DnaD/phage-associated family protein
LARPIKQGLDYFPLDVDIDADDKVAIIEALHGIEGFGIIIKLLMKIYKEGYYYEWTKREQILFSKRINVDINTLSNIIDDCIKEGLFNQQLFETHGILTSKGIQKRYLEAIKRRKQVVFIENYFLIDDVEAIVGGNKIDVLVEQEDGKRVNVNINSGSKGVNDNISTQRKGKQNRGKETTTTKEQKQITPFDFYQQNFGVLSPFMADDIGQWMDDLNDELVIEAMKIALKAGKKWNYAAGILKDWHKNNVKTVDEARAMQPGKNKKGVDWEALA